MLDPTAACIEVTVGGRDYNLQQSPGALQAGRKEGTTGAAVWQSSVRAAEWLAGAQNPLFSLGILGERSEVLELGSGVAGLVPCVLAPRVKTVVASDQTQNLKLLRQNIEGNHTEPGGGKKKAAKMMAKKPPAVMALDWELDDIPTQLAVQGLKGGVDVVVACDTLYNYALIEPFVQACEDVCRVREHRWSSGSGGGKSEGGEGSVTPTLCCVVQQLRQTEVVEQWLERALESFRVWKIPSGMLTGGLAEGSGFAVHVCVLRDGK